jgi:hypothetical protein
MKDYIRKLILAGLVAGALSLTLGIEARAFCPPDCTPPGLSGAPYDSSPWAPPTYQEFQQQQQLQQQNFERDLQNQQQMHDDAARMMQNLRDEADRQRRQQQGY